MSNVYQSLGVHQNHGLDGHTSWYQAQAFRCGRRDNRSNRHYDNTTRKEKIITASSSRANGSRDTYEVSSIGGEETNMGHVHLVIWEIFGKNLQSQAITNEWIWAIRCTDRGSRERQKQFSSCYNE